MLNLDDQSVYQKIDAGDMIGRIRELPQQCRDAWQNVMSFKIPAEYANVNEVVILGMGGSAIGGDLLRTYVVSECKLPVVVWRDYDSPKFLDANSLVIASSYSGGTEETLSAFAQAQGVGARAIAITTGGMLKEMAERNSNPFLLFNYKAQPRAALGHSLIPLLGVFQKLGFIADKSAEVEEAACVLSDLGKTMDVDIPITDNPAKQLAAKLFGRLPVVYGAGFLSEVARRWKGQFNENSKSWASFDLLPELNHNAVVGYQFPPSITNSALLLLLTSPKLHARVLRRYSITEEIMKKAGVECQCVESKGNGILAQMLSTVYIGDFVSYYLAILNQIDPTPVDIISFLKSELAKP
ncbi:MAG: bifunctional phosphoglucose/phosphomannose isomerase [Dehalococcoidia bacterium]|nr:bifunctional phosphoglucose/phosphomannose isomerase [Dehalococcoidia bacterium]